MPFQTKSIRAITCPDEEQITSTSVQLLTDKYNYNQELIDEINKTKIDSDTQYRKGYYESEQYESLTSWYIIFLIVYYILAITLILILVFSANQFLLTTYQTAGIAIGLMLYPIVSHFLFNILKMIYRFIMEFVPKNIYNSI
jgi:hypothetical protein